MKVLDRYVVRELVVPILYCCAGLIVLLLIADLFDKLDDFLRNQTPVRIVLRYYAAQIPIYFVETNPWAAWLGTMFVLVNFGFHNEITAMKATGLKITTIVKPILFLGFLLGIATFIVGNWVVPHAERRSDDLREIYIENKKQMHAEKVIHDVTYFSGGNRLYYFRTFSKSKKEVEGAIVLWLAEGETDETNMRQKMVAKSGLWTPDGWEFENVTEYKMDSRGRILGEPHSYPKKRYTDIRFSPKELENASSESLYLTYRELKRSIDKLKENGVSVSSEKVDLQSRLAMPWQGLIMMTLAIPLLGKTSQRKLIALNVLFCVALVFAFHVTGAVGVALGKAGKLFPFFSAWAGNILFALGALLNLERANY